MCVSRSQHKDGNSKPLSWPPLVRSLESYQDHLRVKVGNCGRKWIALRTQTTLGPELLLVPQTCKSNFCPECRMNNLRSLRSALIRTMQGDRWRLATLTFPDHTADVDELLKDSYIQFKRFTNKLRRHVKALKYIRTLELHQSGMIHYHLVFNKYIPVALLRESWQSVGGGIVDIRATGKCRKCGQKPPCDHIKKGQMPSYKQAARYLTEEIEKTAQDPHRLGYLLWKHRIRTITTSRALKLKNPGKHYEFLGIANSLAEAFEWKEYLERLFYDEPPRKLTVKDTPHGVYIGNAYKDTPQR